MAGLQSIGIPPMQALAMLGRAPHLLTLNVWSPTTQDKVRFLTQVMGKQVGALVVFPGFLKLSLFENTGPRWSFFTLHLPTQAFILGTRLKCSEISFTRVLTSPSLDEACTASGLTKLQLYLEHKKQWQLGEGRKWFRRKKKSNANAISEDDSQQVDDSSELDLQKTSD